MQAVEKVLTKEFLTKAEPLFAGAKSFVAIFKGGNDASGKSWCPDCVVAEPSINNVLIPRVLKNGLPVFYVDVGLREEWREKQNPLRVHPELKIDCVPTVLLVKKGKGSIRLREGEILDNDLLEDFVGEAQP